MLICLPGHHIISLFFLHYVYSAFHGRPLTLETDSSVLNSAVSPKWQKLRELLEINEDKQDKIFTNNKMNEDYLRAVLDLRLQNSKRSDMADAFSKTGKDYLAESLASI